MTLFSNHAPLLRTASFTGFAMPWSSPAFHNLTSLEVDYNDTVDLSISPSGTFLMHCLACVIWRHSPFRTPSHPFLLHHLVNHRGQSHSRTFRV